MSTFRHAEVLAALQPYTHWLAQLYSEAQQAGHSQAQLSQLLDGYISVIIPVLSKQVFIVDFFFIHLVILSPVTLRQAPSEK